MKHIKKVFSVILAFALMLPFFASFAVMADNSAIANKNPLTQKSVLFVGDSICEGLCEWSTMGGITNSGWSGRIIKNNNMTGLNLGKSGASMSNCRGSNTVINQLISQNGQDYDYIIIEGGGNDAWDSCAVGTIANGYDAEFDVNTFAGGLENTFQYAKKHFPNAILGFIFVYQQPMASYGKLADMSEYFTIAETICEKWGVPYLDLYFDEHFNKRVLKTDTKEFLPDYIHPNTAGYDVIAPRIDAWMKTLEQETYNLALNKKVTVSGINKGFYYEHEQWGVMAYDADINDGVASNTLDYNTGDWFGLYNGELTDLCTAPNNVGEIVIDLEKESDISYVRAHLRNDVAAGTSAPSSITVSVSDDGSAYTQIGSLSVKSDDNIVYWADMDANASGRYIKLTATLQSMFCFLNEIEVYGSVVEVEENNIAKFKGYEIIGGTGEGFYLDSDQWGISKYQAPLTDGLYTEINNYTNDWFGFYNGEVVDARNTVDGIGTLVLNLEDIYKLSNISIHMLNDFAANAKAPASIKAYISSDNKSFTEIGTFVVDSTDQTSYWTELNTNAEGQFIKFEFAMGGAFCMLNEIKVDGKFVKEGIKYNDTESENYVNIAFKKNYTVSGSGDGFYWNDNGTITQYQAKLTDGINSDLKNFNNEWFAFYQGEVASTVNTVNGVGTIIIDLEAQYDMTQFRVHMWNSNAEGLKAPTSVKVSVSDNNTDFTEVGYLTLNTNDKTIHWSKLVADATGRYVKMDFTLASTFCMLNEIHVYGSLATNSDDSSDVVDDSSDVVDDSSDVVEDSSDVVEDSSDVVEDSSDVVEDSSDVIEDSSDVIEDSSDVVEDSSDVVDDSSDVVDDSSDVVEDSSDVVEDSSDVVEDSSDVVEDSSDVIEDSSDDTSSDDESSDVIEEENEIGDINGNDKIDMTDYILLKRAYFGTYNFNETQNKAGDINQNGKIDMTDYILLKRIYFGTYTLKK